MLHHLLIKSLLCGGLLSIIMFKMNLVQADSRLVYTNSVNNILDHENIIQIQSDKVRLDEVGSPIYELYDAKTHTLYTIDTQARHYIQSTPETIRARTQELAAAQQVFKEQLKTQLAQLPAERRASAEKRLMQAELVMKTLVPQFELETTQQHDKILNFACDIIRFKIGSQPIQELCRAQDIIIAEQDFADLQALFEFLETVAFEVAKAHDSPPPPKQASLVFDAKLALRTKTLASGRVNELTSVSSEPLDESLFIIPASYTLYDPLVVLKPSAK